MNGNETSKALNVKVTLPQLPLLRRGPNVAGRTSATWVTSDENIQNAGTSLKDDILTFPLLHALEYTSQDPLAMHKWKARGTTAYASTSLLGMERSLFMNKWHNSV